MQRLNRSRIRQSKPRQIHCGLGRPARSLMLRDDVGVNPAAHVPARRDSRKSRRNRRHNFVQHIIGDLLMKRADAAKAPHVQLERFQLNAQLVGDVLNGQVRKVGLSRQRAVAREFRNLDVNQIIPCRMGVHKSVQRGLRLRGLACCSGFAFGHIFLCVFNDLASD